MDFGQIIAILKTALNSAMADPVNLGLFLISCLAIIMVRIVRMAHLFIKVVHRTRDRSDKKHESLKGVRYEPDVRFR